MPVDRPPAPRDLVAAACDQLGAPEVVAWAVGLLDGTIRYDDPSRPSLEVLVGRAARWVLTDPDVEGRGLDLWPRVWGARALLYVWDPIAAPAVVAGLGDPAWRVREMAAKVVRLRELGEAADVLEPRTADDVSRVRVAAIRALARVGEGEHAAAVVRALSDPDPNVRRAAAAALDDLERRLERPVRDRSW